MYYLLAVITEAKINPWHAVEFTHTIRSNLRFRTESVARARRALLGMYAIVVYRGWGANTCYSFLDVTIGMLCFVGCLSKRRDMCGTASVSREQSASLMSTLSKRAR